MSKSAASSEVKSKQSQSPLMVAILPSVFLYIAAVVLVFFAREDFAATTQYWEFFIPVVAFISILSGWSQAYAFDHSRFFYLIKQLLHWGALGGLLWLFYDHGIRDALSAEQYNLVQLYLLGLAALIAGLYLDTKMLFFGAFIACCAYLLADPANSAVLTSVGDAFGIENAQDKPMTMIIAAALVAFVANLFVLIAMRGAVMAKRGRTARG
ncbi:hypothetical protein L0E83_11535 [Marichromatium gracile]|uniref:hypothetical protein n=1 Tax=Marichromatium gracile TaxID=1048 RepID=UPI001F47D8C0|nr:hypothetical protein [Marichromatium gracile]MCF1184059.1 hypothetical protein [Marichromatium gracile]